ncbi:hypothetical protein H5410_008775 [Solanum commersonii]|uniref:Uncharacterized protein n=1 Tax=Solanum commersonii TaxID=4109 RepID=A0A9J6AFX1_SOLCO|nr:hypothetical protein H5410_008775 [Solanum commersonii]
MMKRIGQLREFSNTWVTDISPMPFKILQQNINKSMQCNISWMEKGTLLGTLVVAELSSLRAYLVLMMLLPYTTSNINQFITWTTNEQYEYVATVIVNQQLNHAVKRLHGRPSKARRKEANETKRTVKLSKCGVVMTCSNCHTKGHNKRGMPQKNHENEGNSGGQSLRPFKRPRMVGFGVLIRDDGFTTVNPGMQSSRGVGIGTRVPRRSDEASGDIGY